MNVCTLFHGDFPGGSLLFALAAVGGSEAGGEGTHPAADVFEARGQRFDLGERKEAEGPGSVKV